MKGREYASWRHEHEHIGNTTQALIMSCHLDDDDKAFFEEMARLNKMSGRAIVRTISVARTIADMRCERIVTRDDLCEALGFRLREGIGQ